MSKKLDVIDSPFNPLAGAELKIGSKPEFDMRAVPDCARFSLRISPDDLAHAQKAFGLDIPHRVGTMSTKGGRFALCLGPDDWMLLAPLDQSEAIMADFAALDGSVLYSLVDIGHRTIGIEISGPMAICVLNAGCPLDLEKMAIGACTRSILDKMEIVITKHEQTRFRIEIVRSFAEFVWKYFTVVARGLEPGGN